MGRLPSYQPTPLEIVSSAVAGDGIERVARSASEALGHPVAIVLPSLGEPVVWPGDAVPAGALVGLVEYAVAMADGRPAVAPAHSVPIRIGQDVVGIVAAIAGPENGERSPSAPADDPAWLEAAAAAAAVTRLMRDGPADESDSRRALMEALVGGPSSDPGALVEQGRRLGFDLGRGAIAIYARARDERYRGLPAEALDGQLAAKLGPGRVLALTALEDERTAEREAGALAERLRAAGHEVGVSAPRRQASLLHDAVREAMLLAELACAPQAALAGQEETYRLLIGVLLRDPQELELLRARTISSLLAYDSDHDTELLVTLATFLAHHGSTTETAEAMRLHRHTVGYRLSRVQEVSGLSPYESDGRERLSLGLKAAQILAAQERLTQPG
jgi:PucR C-terminal helix-turn-helix domain